jgi:hypothetical protein
MLNLCGIVVAILKMATGRICSISGINSGHHNVPTSKGVGVTVESYGKVEISYINVDNFYMDNDRDIKFDISNFDDIGQC